MAFSWIRKLLQRPSNTIRRLTPSVKRTRKWSFQPGLEALEDRTVPTSSATSLGARQLGIGDFNNDGKLDIAVNNSGSASILLGNGDGSFQASVTYALPGNTNMIGGDFNNDGNLDLATSNTLSLGT